MLFKEFLDISEVQEEVNTVPGLRLQRLADGLVTPTTLTNDGERIYFCDQIGTIHILENNDIVQKEPFLDITDMIRKLPPSEKGAPKGLNPGYDERGLAGLAFHPNYHRNGKLYITHADVKKETADNGGFNHEQVLVEFTVGANRNRVDSESRRELLRIPQEKHSHNGGKLAFGPDGYLYYSTGDGGCCGDQHGEIGNAQSLASLKGKILRLDVNRNDLIPADNPFVKVKGARSEIYAYGFRNPWGLSFDGNRLFCTMVGEGADEKGDGWETVFLVKRGGNYGWRIREGMHYFDKDLMKKLKIKSADLVDPIHEYDHSLGIAIVGGYIYRGEKIPELQGKFVFGDWSKSWNKGSGQLFYLKQSLGKWRRFPFNYPDKAKTLDYFITSIGECHDKELYILCKKGNRTSNKKGVIFRLSK